MERYQIGRIEGRWENFLPPIQGGSFRSYTKDLPDIFEMERADVSRTGSDTSRTPSPVFDMDDTKLRRRTNLTNHPPQSSVSSASSVSEVEDGMSYFDAYTKEQIDLDHAKYPSLDLVTQDEVVRKYRLLDQRYELKDYMIVTTLRMQSRLVDTHFCSA